MLHLRGENRREFFVYNFYYTNSGLGDLANWRGRVVTEVFVGATNASVTHRPRRLVRSPGPNLLSKETEESPGGPFLNVLRNGPTGDSPPHQLGVKGYFLEVISERPCLTLSPWCLPFYWGALQLKVESGQWSLYLFFLPHTIETRWLFNIIQKNFFLFFGFFLFFIFSPPGRDCSLPGPAWQVRQVAACHFTCKITLWMGCSP